MLAGIVNAPSRLAPTRNLKAAQDRAALVLASMRDQKLISPEMEKLALGKPATVAPRPRRAPSAMWLTGWWTSSIPSWASFPAM